MEGYTTTYNSHNQFQSRYGDSRSPSTERADIMLAECNPKKKTGRKKFKETRHPVYRGIRKRGSGKWVSEVRRPSMQSRIWLGTFPTPEMAARAHDVAAIALRGRSACLNFADSASLLVPDSDDVKGIQRAAAEAAEAFRPRPLTESTEVEVEVEEEERKESGSVEFMCAEDLFWMPGIIADMYNGMMLAPPVSAYVADDYVEYDMDYKLWNH